MPRFYRLLTICVLPVILSSCAGNEPVDEDKVDPRIGETRAYIDALELETLSYIRYPEPLRYTPINMRYAILETNAGRFLLETERLCRPLMETTAHSDMIDVRRMRGRLRVSADTIRGCRLSAIYVLPEVEEVAEVADNGLPEE